MKRSDMVNKIQSYLNMKLDLTYCNVTISTEDCEDLLIVIEAYGMLPPTIFKEKIINRGTADEFSVYDYNEWEPEDSPEPLNV